MPTDPFIERRIRRASPALHSHHRRFLQLERDELLGRLDRLDAVLDVSALERAEVLARLRAIRDHLWPRVPRRHWRRPPVLDRPPLPPPVSDALPVGGRDLRGACLVLLRRLGPLDLPTLHGQLHRHGLVIASARPVQRLADALAYEVAQGRAERVSRGVYAAVPGARGGGGSPDPSGDVALPDLGLPWGEEGGEPLERARVEEELRLDPSRWGATAWDEAVETSPGDDSVGREVAAQDAAVRARLAALLPPIPHVVGGDSSEIRRQRQPRGLHDWAGWAPPRRAATPPDEGPEAPDGGG